MLAESNGCFFLVVYSIKGSKLRAGALSSRLLFTQVLPLPLFIWGAVFTICVYVFLFLFLLYVCVCVFVCLYVSVSVCMCLCTQQVQLQSMQLQSRDIDICKGKTLSLFHCIFGVFTVANRGRQA